MGTWHMPENDKERTKLFNKLKKLRLLELEIQKYLDDDIVLDHTGLATGRIEKFCTHVTMECMHPAFYYVEDGDLVRGVCKLCRNNVEEPK